MVNLKLKIYRRNNTSETLQKDSFNLILEIMEGELQCVYQNLCTLEIWLLEDTILNMFCKIMAALPTNLKVNRSMLSICNRLYLPPAWFLVCHLMFFFQFYAFRTQPELWLLLQVQSENCVVELNQQNEKKVTKGRISPLVVKKVKTPIRMPTVKRYAPKRIKLQEKTSPGRYHRL
jgi:hypothetical protein